MQRFDQMSSCGDCSRLAVAVDTGMNRGALDADGARSLLAVAECGRSQAANRRPDMLRHI